MYNQCLRETGFTSLLKKRILCPDVMMNRFNALAQLDSPPILHAQDFGGVQGSYS
ncbi:MAG: hypothetical protein ACTSUE_09175 [Promethearchaeota archaeon]